MQTAGISRLKMDVRTCAELQRGEQTERIRNQVIRKNFKL
jgi:hypothetical protein